MKELIEKIEEVCDAWEGFVVKTSTRTIRVCIDNNASCCESWGHLSSDDDLQQYVGAELLKVASVDTMLNLKTDPGELDAGDIQFVNFDTDRGRFQLAVYDSHNGYYGHEINIEGI